jgi:integrase
VGQAEQASPVLLPETGRLHRCPTEPASRPSVDDVDRERGAIAFTRGLAVGPKGSQLRSTKNHRTYRVELDPETLAVLSLHRELAEAQAREASVELTGGAFVFSRCADGATPWLPNWTTKEFVRARRAAGLPQFRLHDLRHFMATEMLAAGVPIVTVSQRLSHARVSTTLNVYAHSVPGGDRRAAETLAAILSSGRLPNRRPVEHTRGM